MKANNTGSQKHGMWLSPEYKTWISIKSRCFNKNDPNYKKYGARGVVVWPAWVKDFKSFYDHIGPRPSVKHSIDRFPKGDGNYEPGNVRWATSVEQNNNRRNCVPVEYQGERKNVAQWAAQYGMNRHALGQRIRRGWPMEKALFTPLRTSGPRKAGA